MSIAARRPFPHSPSCIFHRRNGMAAKERVSGLAKPANFKFTFRQAVDGPDVPRTDYVSTGIT